MSSTDKNSSQFEISYETSAEAMTATPAKKHASGILNPENDGWLGVTSQRREASTVASPPETDGLKPVRSQNGPTARES
ncbi:hypothetical protein PABG_12509 [Paracoccidioides brasiliensis Pb03]|nr:hypothetical protein PABG_12509 [Paracoccidioides brasiliensis Pb03]